LNRIEGYSFPRSADRMGIRSPRVEKHAAKAILLMTDWMDDEIAKDALPSERYSSQQSREGRRKSRAEAAAWVVKLHGPHRTPALEAAFRDWLSADEENGGSSSASPHCGMTRGVFRWVALHAWPTGIARPLVESGLLQRWYWWLAVLRHCLATGSGSTMCIARALESNASFGSTMAPVSH